MKALKNTFLAVVIFGGLISTTSCGTISCHAYVNNETDEQIEKDLELDAPAWAEATFAEELPNG